MKNFSDTFTQGGQTQLHKFRMINQVFGTTLKVSSIIAFLCFVFLLIYDGSWEKFGFLFTFYKAQIRDSMSYLPKEFFDTSWILQGDGKYYEISDHIIAHKQEYILSSILIHGLLFRKLFQTFLCFLGSMILLFLFWGYSGKALKIKEIISGGRIVHINKLTNLIKKSTQASDLTLAGLPLVKNRETEHMLLIGTTGCGKTNAMNELLQQIRNRGDKIVIVDTTNGFVERFYDEKRDIILNPLDSRSKNWNLWEECTEEYLFDEFSESLIPQIGHDPFWSNSARTVLTVAAKQLADENDYSLQRLMEITVSLPLKEVYPYFAGSIAASMMHPDSEKTALSIRSTIASSIKCFEHLEEAEENFSIRQWILDPEQSGILFLSCAPEQRSSLRPLLSGWLSLATKAALSRPEGTEKKLWFFIDELSSLNKLPSLPNSMAEVRKYCGCFVLGLQNLSQLDDLYGTNMSRSICGLTGTKLVFRSPDAYTAKRMSEFLGEQEIIEHSESISFGAHQMRDGVSLSEQRRNKTVIPYTDILNLPNLQAYIKFPCDLPLVKLKFQYHEF
ncbi:MAG: type IV conjugative transfer system coupling protein TraD [Candidatus Paracaedibacteraceae bacterium]|nr:type IV conjugative transfer system coupling protein TraD [Candidatus Paracaedibacteraceae bacterium]